MGSISDHSVRFPSLVLTALRLYDLYMAGLACLIHLSRLFHAPVANGLVRSENHCVDERTTHDARDLAVTPSSCY